MSRYNKGKKRLKNMMGQSHQPAFDVRKRLQTYVLTHGPDKQEALISVCPADNALLVNPPLAVSGQAYAQRGFKDPLEFQLISIQGRWWTKITPRISREDIPHLVAWIQEGVSTVGLDATLRMADAAPTGGVSPFEPAAQGSTNPWYFQGKVDKKPDGERYWGVGKVEKETASKPVWRGFNIKIHPYAFSKLMFLTLYNGGRTEIGGYGQFTKDPNDPMTYNMHSFRCVPHSVANGGYHEFDLAGVHEHYIEPMLDAHPGVQANDLMALWFHSHPGPSATPSNIDWGTLESMNIQTPRFMCIVGTGGALTAHVKYWIESIGVYRVDEVDISVDYSKVDEIIGRPAEDKAAWIKEYDDFVRPVIATYNFKGNPYGGHGGYVGGGYSTGYTTRHSGVVYGRTGHWQGTKYYPYEEQNSAPGATQQDLRMLPAHYHPQEVKPEDPAEDKQIPIVVS